MRLHPAQDICCTHRAWLARDFAAVLEQRQRRNAADRVARAQVGHGLGINLRQPHLGFQLSAGLLVGGCHLPAGAAPRRPKIDQHRDLAAANVLVKRSFVECRRVPSKKRLLATAASRVAGKLVDLHAVGGVAMGADDVQ